ncbi:MAG: hypothetical protein HY584_01245, partial [Candidatus Omnitrophica bacterium]|nr:hypothetical protein [Candidatus Omnitrophota bacterium]
MQRIKWICIDKARISFHKIAALHLVLSLITTQIAIPLQAEPIEWQNPESTPVKAIASPEPTERSDSSRIPQTSIDFLQDDSPLSYPTELEDEHSELFDSDATAVQNSLPGENQDLLFSTPATISDPSVTREVTDPVSQASTDQTSQISATSDKTVLFATTTTSSDPFRERGGLVVVESEHPHEKIARIGQSWQLQTSLTGYSGEGYLYAGPDSGVRRDTGYTTNSPELRYNFYLQSTGTYYVWVRGRATNGSNNSVHVGLDGLATTSSDRIVLTTYNVFTWSKNTLDNVRASLEIASPGFHTLNVWMRDDGFRFDKILITKDPNFVPQELGPQESERAWDLVPPTGSITINKNATYTNSVNVTLTLTGSDTGSGVDQMRFSTNGGTTWTSWEPFKTSKSLTLPSGDGTKEVKFELKDKQENIATFSDTIILDTILPSLRLLSSPYVDHRDYRLRYKASDLHMTSMDQTEAIELTRGWNQITRSVTDNAGNKRTVTWKIFLDENAERGNYFGYDGNGNVTSQRDANGDETKYEYDGNNRLTKITYADGSTIRYTYNARGDRTSMQDSTGTTFYLYDQANRLVRVVQSTGQVIDYGYDTASNLTQMIYGGATIKYSYDKAGRLAEVREQRAGQTEKITTYAYNDAGELVERKLPNGIRTRQSYDTAGRLTGIVHEKLNSDGTATHIASYTYTLDKEGNRTRMLEKRGSGASQTTRTVDYTYDFFGRLTKEIDSSRGTTTYSYDKVGNRLTKEFTPLTITSTNPRLLTRYTYGLDNRLNSFVEEKYDATATKLGTRTETFVYDALGNLRHRVTPDKTIYYEYDFEGRLILWFDGQTFVEFIYDGDGNRIGKRVNGEWTYYVVDPNREITQVLGELDSNGAVKQSYLYGLDRISFTRYDTKSTTYDLEDGLDSTIAVTDSAGALKKSHSYEGFGNHLGSTSSLFSPFLFTGEQLDPETNLIYLRNRYYDPNLGRFISRDPILGPITETQRLNPYPYVENNPVNSVDPTGLVDQTVEGVSENLKDPIRWLCKGSELCRQVVYELEISLFPLGAARDVKVAGSLSKWLNELGEQVGRSPKGRAVVQYLYDVAVKIFPKVLREGEKESKSPMRWLREIIRIDPAEHGKIEGLDSSLPFVKGIFTGANELRLSLIAGAGGFIGLGSNWSQSFLGSLRAGSRGGVLLNQALQVTGLSIKDITGVTFDPYTGQVVLLSEDAVSVPEIPVDYFITALKAIFGTQQDPGVTIDPQLGPDGKPDWSREQTVKHFAGIEDTQLGWVVYEADRMMKSINLGKDNVTKSTITQDGYDISESFIAVRIPGFKNMLTRWSGLGERYSRFWFVPKEMKLVRTAEQDAFVFDNNSVQLLTEDLLVGGGAEDPEAKAYADFFTAYYDEFARLYPIFEELKKASRAVALAKFILDHNIPVDLNWLRSASIPTKSTPRTTPVGENSSGTAVIRGGVSVDFINGLNFSYLSDTQGTAAGVRSASLNVRPTDLTTKWDFTASGKSFDASAFSLAPTRKDTNFYWQESDLKFSTTGDFDLEWRRFYDSFSPVRTKLGLGWTFLPYSIESTEVSRTYVFNGQTKILFPKIRFSDRIHQQTEDMTFVGFRTTDGAPVYSPDGTITGSYLAMNGDGSFTVQYDDRSQIHFLSDGRLDFLEDQSGNRIQYGYDASGRLSSIKDLPSGRQINLAYDSSGRITQVNGPEGKTIAYTYDATTGDLKTMTPSWTNRKITYDYDSAHRLLKATDHTGKVLFTNTYDAIGRLTSQKDQDGNLRQITPNLLTHETVTLDPLNQAKSKTTYDSFFRLLSVRNPVGGETKFTYGGAFGPTSIRDPRGKTTQFTYDGLGNERTMTNPLGHISRFDYGGNLGDIRLHFNQEGTGFGQFFDYDATGNLKSLMEGVLPVRDANGNLTAYYPTALVTQFTYDSKGNLSGVTDANSNKTSFFYDSVGNLTSITNPLGKSSTLTYETAGGVTTRRISQIKDPLNRFINFTYDPVSEQVKKVSTASGEMQYAYDSRDRLSQVTNALGRVNKFQYDANDNLIETREVGDPLNTTDDIVAKFQYDRLGNLISLAGPLGGATSFSYDLLNRLTRTLTPETTPLTQAKTIKTENITSSSARIRVGLSETISRAVVHINEVGRKAFKTVTLEGPLSGEIIFDVEGLKAGTKYEYEIELIDPEAHHSFARKRTLLTSGTAPSASEVKAQALYGKVYDVTSASVSIGVVNFEVNPWIVDYYQLTVTPAAGGTPIVTKVEPVFRGSDGRYYLTVFGDATGLQTNTDYRYKLEVVPFSGVPFDLPQAVQGTFRTANSSDTSSPQITQRNLSVDTDRAVLTLSTNESLLKAEIRILNLYTGQLQFFDFFNPSQGAKLLIPDLLPETPYEYLILMTDRSGNDVFSNVERFATKGFDGDSSLVLQSRVTGKTDTSAKIEILTDEQPKTVRLEYREKNTSSWFAQSLNTANRKNIFFVSGLAPTKSYEYRVLVLDASSNRFVGPLRDLVLYSEKPSPPKQLSNGIFELSLDNNVLSQAAQSGPVGWSLELSKKLLGTFKDTFDFLVFVPSLSGGKRLSLQTQGSTSDNEVGSFYLGARNDVSGIGEELFDYRSLFGSSSNGELEGMAVLDSAFMSRPEFRFASSNFSKDQNLVLWENVLTQELAHRFGAFLTAQAGNPFGMLGRDLAHWSVFFDAEFSPMDGNDWVDNGGGTFTLKRSFLGEAAFTRSALAMPYNDLDLYTMGLLDPMKVRSSFVIQNPTLEDGRKLRPYNGNLVQVQNSDGTWSDPVVLPTGITIKGTKKNITLQDLTALEGQRNPAFPNTQKDFKVAFLTLTNDEESPLDTLEMTQKLARFKDSFVRFFKGMTRNLGTVSTPTGQLVTSGTTGALSAFTSNVVSGAFEKNLRLTSTSSDPAPGNLLGPYFAHFDPEDLDASFLARSFSTLFPSTSGVLHSMNKLAFPLGPFLNSFVDFLLPEEVLPPFLRPVSSLAISPPARVPNTLSNSANIPSLEKPILYSDWKQVQRVSLRDPFKNDSLRTSDSPHLRNQEAVPLIEARPVRAGTPNAFSQTPIPFRSIKESTSTQASRTGGNRFYRRKPKSSALTFHT